MSYFSRRKNVILCAAPFIWPSHKSHKMDFSSLHMLHITNTDRTWSLPIKTFSLRELTLHCWKRRPAGQGSSSPSQDFLLSRHLDSPVQDHLLFNITIWSQNLHLISISVLLVRQLWDVLQRIKKRANFKCGVSHHPQSTIFSLWPNWNTLRQKTRASYLLSYTKRPCLRGKNSEYSSHLVFPMSGFKGFLINYKIYIIFKKLMYVYIFTRLVTTVSVKTLTPTVLTLWPTILS